MHRGDNKLEKVKKKQEEIDNRLREAGLYDDNYSQETKAKLLQFVEESFESARQQEKEREMEEKILAETLAKSSTHKESVGSSSTNKCTKKKVCVENMSPLHPKCQESEPGPSASSKACMSPVSTSRSPVIKSHVRVNKQHTQDKKEDDDLIILTQEQADHSELQSTKTRTEYSPSVIKKTPQSGRGEWHERIRNTKTVTPKQPGSIHMTISSSVNKSKVTSTTNITTSVVMPSDEDSDTDIVPSSQEASKKVRQTNLNPHVVLVPLIQPRYPLKNAIQVYRKDLTPNKHTTPTEKSPVVTDKGNASQKSTVIENSPSFQKDSNDLYRTPLSPSVSNSTFTSSKAAGSQSPSKKSATSNFPKDSSASSITRNLSSSLVEDSGPSRKCMSSTSTSSEVICITDISSTVTTTITTTTPSHILPTSTTTANIPSHNEAVEPTNAPNASLGSDCEVKPLSNIVYRNIDVFSSRSDHKPPLRRKKSLRSEASDKAFHRAPMESIKQCRSRIFTLMNNMILHLQQHQSHLPPTKWPPPLIVDKKLRNSLERPRPASQQRQQMERPESQKQFTCQVTRYSQDASNPVADSIRAERTTRVQRRGYGRTLGPRSTRSTRPNIPPHSKETSDSDSDLEISLPSQSSYSQSQSNTLETKNTVLNPKTKLKNHLQQHRRVLDSVSVGSDSDCRVEDEVTKMDHHTENSCLSEWKNAAPVSPSNISELCIIDDEPHSKLTQPPIPRLFRQGIRRPAAEVPDSTPSKLRKTHSLNQESSTMKTVSGDTNEIPSTSSDCTPSFEDPDEWRIQKKVNQEEEEDEENEREKEEKIPCPLCQRLYSVQEIEEHASDCGEVQDSQEHQQQHTLTHGLRRLRGTNEESAVAVVSSSDAKEREESWLPQQSGT